MPRKQEWTVRVVQITSDQIPAPLAKRDELPGVWIECLRYMGLAHELATLDNPERNVIEFYAPHGYDSQVWANQNADRMRSFGINAAAAPKWERGQPLEVRHDGR